jgi:hypothetical protein
MAAQGLGAGLSAFAEAFITVRDNDPEYQARRRAEANLAYAQTPAALQLDQLNIQKEAARETAQIGRNRDREMESQLSFYDDPLQKEALRSTFTTMDLPSIERMRKDTIDNPDFTGFVHLNPDEVEMKTYLPIVQGDFKQVGTTDFWYHSAKSLKGKFAKAADRYTYLRHKAKKLYMEEKDVDTISPEVLRTLEEATFDLLDPDQQALFRRQSVNFNTALNKTITRYTGGTGSMIITDSVFRRALVTQKAKLDYAIASGSDEQQRKIKNEINELYLNHKAQQQLGYGFNEGQYRTELKGMLAHAVGAYGLSNTEQIENFMGQFLEDERNKARLLARMIRKYGAPKTDTGAGGGSNASTVDIPSLKVEDSHLDLTGMS